MTPERLERLKKTAEECNDGMCPYCKNLKDCIADLNSKEMVEILKLALKGLEAIS